MMRYMDYGISLDIGQQLYLVCHISKVEGDAYVKPEERLSHHGYILETAEHKVSLTPEQLELLRCAICEMQRKSGELRDVLTDGASVGAVERAVAAEEAPDESGPGGVVWSPGVIGTLANLAHGHLLSEGNALFGLLSVNGLIAPKNGPGDWYTITDAGRRVLAEADDA